MKILGLINPIIEIDTLRYADTMTIDDWMKSLDENTPLDAIYLDFRKAFGTVPYKRLIEKLKGNEHIC